MISYPLISVFLHVFINLWCFGVKLGIYYSGVQVGNDIIPTQARGVLIAPLTLTLTLTFTLTLNRTLTLTKTQINGNKTNTLSI